MLTEHLSHKPVEVQNPTDILSLEQDEVAKELSKINKQLDLLQQKQDESRESLREISAKKKAYKNIKDGFEILSQALNQFNTELENDINFLGLDSTELVKLEIDKNLIATLEINISTLEAELKENQANEDATKAKLLSEKPPLNAKLNAPLQAYTKYQEEIKAWEDKQARLVGSGDEPESQEGLKYRKAQLEKLPIERQQLFEERLLLSREIYKTLIEQKQYREELFKPVQFLIQNNALIRDEYKLQFMTELSSTADHISNILFSIIKQASGEFRGDTESRAVIKNLMDTHNFDNEDSLINFVQVLYEKLEKASNNEYGISSLLRIDRRVREVYDFLFGLSYLEPRYTLMFQDAQIGQLSPGQRGALLLIFYLLVDKGDTPIILDQPEENLDNETIVSLLVPVLTEAKQKRQIIMVTHNPNLAVVCDAEQIIHCEFDRKNGNNITYTPGAIECRLINSKVVNVLEGTMMAFDNRREKYMSQFK